MSFELEKSGEDRRGLFGGFLGMFVATIVVVVILFLFVFVSGIVKIISGNKGGVAVRTLKMSGISNIYSYTTNFVKLVNIRAKVVGETDLDAAIQEVEYVEK